MVKDGIYTNGMKWAWKITSAMGCSWWEMHTHGSCWRMELWKMSRCRDSWSSKPHSPRRSTDRVDSVDFIIYHRILKPEVACVETIQWREKQDGSDHRQRRHHHRCHRRRVWERRRKRAIPASSSSASRRLEICFKTPKTFKASPNTRAHIIATATSTPSAGYWQEDNLMLHPTRRRLMTTNADNFVAVVVAVKIVRTSPPLSPSPPLAPPARK